MTDSSELQSPTGVPHKINPALTADVYMRCRSWVRHCTTSQEAADSVPHGVTGIFHWHNHSSHTKFLIEIRTRNTYWGKGGLCVQLTNLPPSCADFFEIWKPLTLGNLRAWIGLHTDCFSLLTFYVFFRGLCEPQGRFKIFGEELLLLPLLVRRIQPASP